MLAALHTKIKSRACLFQECNGKILLHCQAGCDTHRIVETIGLHTKDLFIQERCSGGGWELLREHLYHDESGNIVAKKELYLKPDGSKTGVWYRLCNGKYEKGLKNLKAPLYNLPTLISSTGTVYIAEGEKDSDTLIRMGLVTTSSPNGAGSKWKASYNQYFTDRDVVILTDNDEAGRLYGEDIKRGLVPVAKSVKIVPATAIWQNVPPKGDISDIAARLGTDTAKEMLAAAVDAVADEAKSSKESYTSMPGGYLLKDGCLYRDMRSQGENSSAKQELIFLLNGWVEATGISWLRPQMDELPAALKSRFQALRGASQQEGHGRTTESIAHLQIGIETLARFLVDRGEIDATQAETMQRDSWRIFINLAMEQNRRISQDRPTKLFLDALKEMIETKAYNIAPVNSTSPYGEYTPEKLLGYSDNNFVYLYPESSYRAIKMFYSASDINFPLSKSQLFKHLKIEQLIEAGEQQTTKQKKIRGYNGKWLWLKKSALQINETDE